MKINEDLGLRRIAQGKDTDELKKAADYSALLDDGPVKGWGLVNLFEAGVKLGAKALSLQVLVESQEIQRIELDEPAGATHYFIGTVEQVQRRLDQIQ